MKRSLLLCVCASALSARLSFSQCPDGSPPPCRGARPSGAAAARSIDERTWIVLPFSNVARATDLDWLSSASVNLLYNDMSHWTDIHVVDDERVADLLRDVPEAGRSQLGLEGGMAVARRAGARNLVMGDLLHEGPRTSIIAKVFDVRTGTRVRTVRVQTVGTDSISASFSQLARLVLSVPPPSGTRLSGVGTSSVEALRAYSSGMEADRRGRNDSAETHFRRAIVLDSTFALAYYRLGAMLAQSRGPTSAQDSRQAYQTALRLSGGLPERERLLIALAGATTPAARCDLGARMLALDSSDVNGWVTLGQCLTAEQRVVLDADGRVQSLGSWNEAIRHYQRTLHLEPENGSAFSDQMNILYAQERLGCLVARTGPCPLDSLFVAANVAGGDTIASRFERWARFDRPSWRQENLAGRRVLLERARDLAAAWTAANPQHWLGHLWYGFVLLRLGDLVGADRELTAAAEVGQMRANYNRFVTYAYRIELDLRRELPSQAAVLVDSLFNEAGVPGAEAQYVATFGRFSRPVAAADTTVRLRELRSGILTAFSGIVPADYPQTVRAWAEARAVTAAAGRADLARQDILALGTVLGFHSLRSGPALDTASALSLLRYQAFLVRADTSRARRALAEFDSTLLHGPDDVFTGRELFSAESYVELGDSTTAWERMQRFAHLWPGYSLNDSGLWRLGSATPLVGRAWLLYADLAMARGAREEARRGYRFVVGLWEGGEAPVQPLVARARAALAQLGN